MLRTRSRLGLFLAAAALWAASDASALTARYNTTVTLMSDGSMLVVGGFNSAGTPLATVEVYLSTGSKLESRAPLAVARASHTATLLPDGRVLVTGGISIGVDAANCDSGGVSTVCRRGAIYNPRTDTWSNTANEMAAARMSHTATLLPNGKVLITGGQTTIAGAVTASCDLFNPASNSFQACGTGQAMQMARAGHTATLLHNGHVLAAGGYLTGGTVFSNTTEIYDAVTDAWSAGPALRSGRAWHTATQMGNQQVLIAGGFDGVNLREDQGILETTEIYDPNSNTISPGTPMQARKMFHSVNLTGSGEVHIYGGLGNITTSYLQAGLTFNDPSTLIVTENGSSWLDAVITPNASSLRVTPDIKLSVGVSGLAVDAFVNFSSPTVQLSDAKVLFSYPDQTEGSLDGLYTGPSAGEFDSQFLITKHSGRVAFTPQKASSADVLISAGALRAGSAGIGPTCNTNVNPIVPGTTYCLIPGTSQLTGQIQVPMPSSDVNGTVVTAAAIITAGSISLPSSNAVQGYDVKLTSGVAQFSGQTVTNDPVNGPVLIANVTFNGVQGTIADSTTTNEATPINPTGQKMTSLSLELYYIVSPITLSNASFNFDIATVSIHKMIFEDQENLNPMKNTWSFGTPGSAIFSHSETLLPNGDEVFFGGRTCTSVANCTNETFTAQGGPGAYILLQQSNTPWTGVGDLNMGRSNHTLTLLPDGRVLAAGGQNASNALTGSELYDPTARTWAQAADMKSRRSHHTATLLPNGNVLVAGGFTTISQSTGATNAAEIFYPPTAAWVPTGQMLSSRAYHVAVPLPNGNVFAMGGFTNGVYLSSTEVYISTAAKWLAGPPIGGGAPEPRAHFTATLLRDGRIIVIGGVNASNGTLNTSKIFDPQAWTWSNGPALSFARHSHTATLLRDGRVLVVGGDSAGGELGHSEIYDPVLNVFQRVREDLGGNDIGFPRFGHSAVLLPDGKVLVVGGYGTLSGPITYAEGFDVDFSTWQLQGQTAVGRGDHATVLLQDGFLLNVGGFDGLSYRPTSEVLYYSAFPDAATLAGGQARRPQIVGVQPAPLVQPGTLVTALGSNFRGVTEASGGGSAGMNSSHAHPRVYLQRASGGGAQNGDAGWMVDLTSGAFNSGVNSWSTMDGSVTFTVPYTSATLPLGWYHLRMAANDQFSKSFMVQVAPPRPTAIPGIPIGTPVGPASITWTWAAASGGPFDGYSVYSATSGVFIATVTPSGGGVESFLQSGLGPDTSSLIQVAAYNVGGDGQVVAATNPVVTAVSGITGLQGIAQSPRTIFWSWNPISGANSYQVFSATSGLPLATVLSANFTQTALSTNTAYSVIVQANMPGGPGFLSGSATTYTQAALPVPDSPPFTAVTTGSFVARWRSNTNPAGTQYELQFFVNGSTLGIHISSIVGLNFGLFGGTPNTLYAVSVAAQNGDGLFTAFQTLGSTYTQANPPLNAVVTAAGPSFVSIQWDPNGNPGTTPYQLLYSNDNFVTNVSTFIPFSASYTTTSATISPLLTAQTYTMRVTAINGFGLQTAAASTQAFTTNGGGPPGSLTFTAPATNFASLDGTLSSTTVTRRFTMSVPANAFTADTQIFVSTLSAFNCGAIPVGVSIVNSPGLQPKLPLDIAIQYYPTDPNLGPLATLGMVRYDPASGACVPLLTTIDTTNNLVHAKINHFSNYQLMQITPQASSGLGLSRIFPNPFNASRQSYVTFDRLPANARIRVYTIHGEALIDVPTNASGIATWNGTNITGRPVASGIYLVEIQSGGDKKILKLVVIR